MVKSVLGVNHQGLRDWLFQRMSALIMIVYTLGMVGYFVQHPHLAFYEWQFLFSHAWMKIATLFVVMSLLYHAWVGMWTIYTDYITCYVLRLIMHTLTFIALIIFFFTAFWILWGI